MNSSLNPFLWKQVEDWHWQVLPLGRLRVQIVAAELGTGADLILDMCNFDAGIFNTQSRNDNTIPFLQRLGDLCMCHVLTHPEEVSSPVLAATYLPFSRAPAIIPCRSTCWRPPVLQLVDKASRASKMVEKLNRSS